MTPELLASLALHGITAAGVLVVILVAMGAL